MTATPIPRTLAIIVYGDLDISIIDELPPNRKKIDTIAVKENMTDRIIQFIKKNVDEGRQAYIVCPCLLYKSDAADEEDSVDLGGRRIIKKYALMIIL